MGTSSEMRRLQNKWLTGTSWPKRLEWIEIDGIRGWGNQRIGFNFPIVAIVGENGSGKSTILQAAAAVYSRGASPKELYASEFFPDTPFEQIRAATIRFAYREGTRSETKTIRKPTGRWRGNPERPSRPVEYVDLSRIQPVGARVGYSKLLKVGVSEHAHAAFDTDRLARISAIMGKQYTSAGISTTTVDQRRTVPVLSASGSRYSGFHQGAGEIAAAELLAKEPPKYALVLIDEIETSLHPRAQRRLIDDLAKLARVRELQIILTTHSPYVLDQIPPEGRVYIMDGAAGKTVVTGVSPDFAMTMMDEEAHPEADIYVEDRRAVTLVHECLVAAGEREALSRVRVLPYGTASVGQALGQMRAQGRFPRPTVVFLDGDQDGAQGCDVLPREDAPERVVFEALKAINWPGVAEKIGRGPSETIDALNRSVTVSDHHDWVTSAADALVVGGEVLWQAMCASWATNCAQQQDIEKVVRPITDALQPS